MAAEVLVLARDPAFCGALSRLIDVALDVQTFATTDEVEAEDTLAEHTPVLVVESRGNAEDFAFILRAWRINPEAPVIVCSPKERAIAHLAFGPLEVLTDPAMPGALVRAVRRGLLCMPWNEGLATAPRGLPRLLASRMSPSAVIELLEQDPLTFNLWREASNPNFRAADNFGDTFDVPMEACVLPRADLQRKNLSRANLTRITLCGANLARAQGLFVQLAGADLRKCDLSHTVLVGSNLSGADLKGANLDGTELFGCDLRGVRFSATQHAAVILTDCEFDRGHAERPLARTA